MALRIINSPHSFVRFGDADSFEHCIFGTVAYQLPVLDQDDVHFQFIVQTDTQAEADALCTIDGSEVNMELVSDCGDVVALIDLPEKPIRYRLSPTQVLYNWPHGFTGWPGPIADKQCFRIRTTITTNYGSLINCSNLFQRITEECYTSVLDYGNEDDAFGFKYCTGGAIDDGGNTPADCSPTVVTFFNESTLSIPYTVQLQDKYGLVPSIQVWIYDDMGILTNMGITATFDAVPPTTLNFDFGGPASGIIVIR
jgi:hypothetical protein